MKIIRLSVFRKFAITASVVVLFFGMINLYFLWNSVYRSFEYEIEKRSEVLSKLIAERALQPLVYHNYVDVYRVLDEIKSIDPSIAYIFILDDQKKIIAQNYDVKIPFELIRANNPVGGKSNIKVIYAENFQHRVIRDIAYPVLDGEIGIVRLGLIEENIRQELNIATRTLTLMVLSFLVIGLIGAFFFSFLITLPIKKITKKSQQINLKDIKDEEFDIKPLRFRSILGVYFSDELDILVGKFTEMIRRLRNNVNELETTRDSIIQAEKLASIGTLTAGISHEINNPLAGIKNCVRRIEKEPENKEQNLKYVELINDALDKIENVVKPLLDFSRKTDFMIMPTEINPIVEHSIKLTEFKIRKSNITVLKDFEEDCILETSKNHLEQVLINLILNGIDAIEEKKELVPGYEGKLSFVTRKSNNNTFEIIVKDNGKGIAEENHHKIFDPFFTSKKVGKGTGLGLYVSYNILKELNGNIKFESSTEEGTKFIVELSNIKAG